MYSYPDRTNLRPAHLFTGTTPMRPCALSCKTLSSSLVPAVCVHSIQTSLQLDPFYFNQDEVLSKLLAGLRKHHLYHSRSPANTLPANMSFRQSTNSQTARTFS